MKLSIVVVTYNSPEWTARCLDALAGDAAPGVPHEVIVVDSGSHAAAREALRGRAGQAKVLLVDGNIGFGRGCNLGVRHSTGTHILLLNPDAVAHPGAHAALPRARVDAEDHALRARRLDHRHRCVAPGRMIAEQDLHRELGQIDAADAIRMRCVRFVERVTHAPHSNP